MKSSRSRAFCLLGLLAAAVGTLEATVSKREPLAGMVVKSREYVVRRSPREQEEFIGNVSYKHGDRHAEADWALYDHSLQNWRARGHVHGSDRLASGDTIDVWGDVGEHDLRSKRGWLAGKDPSSRVRFERRLSPASMQANARLAPPLPATPSKFSRLEPGIDKGDAARLEWDETKMELSAKGDVHVLGPEGEARARQASWREDDQILRLNGDVHLERPEGEAWAENASYERSRGTLHLDGRRPVTRYRDPQWEGAVQADRIAAFQTAREMKAEGGVVGWIVFENPPRNKGRKPKR